MKKLPIKQLPDSLPLRKLIGPSFILLGLGLGSGEVILWPYLTSNYGMGIIWGALLGITFQFFMNMEIERYTLINGESIFVGFTRKLKKLPLWFLFSTYVPWMWPGIAAAAATVFATAFGWNNTPQVTIALLIIMGLILSLGPILYKTLETFQKLVIAVGVPTIFLLSIYLADRSDWTALVEGSIGLGNGYLFLPVGIPLASFLAALAYSGAGGNLNLAQSFYIREKGYGMGKYAGKITSVLTGEKQQIELTGSTFTPNKANVARFNKWWKNVNIEHFFVFWLMGSITIILLGLLSYITTYGLSGNEVDISFVLREAEQIAQLTIPALGTFFLLVAGFTLFGTQMTVFDATSRILTENVLLTAPERAKKYSVRGLYYVVLWVQLITAIMVILSGFHQPLQLLTLSAVLNAFAMFVHIGLTLWLNKTALHPKLRPTLVRTTAMVLAFLFYGAFSFFTLLEKIL